MGFFTEFNIWLNAVLFAYIGNNVTRVAAALEPAVVTLGVIYVMIWGVSAAHREDRRARCRRHQADCVPGDRAGSVASPVAVQRRHR